MLATKKKNKVKLLTFTTLYPNSVMPRHAVFVENRLQHLLASQDVESTVIAPVPWFPFKNRCFGKYANYAAVPREEIRNGVRVLHPRYFLIPKMSMFAAPFLMAWAARSAVKQLQKEGYQFDLVDAHYFYPDGVAAVMLGRRLGKPVVVTSRGSDINILPNYLMPRLLIKWAFSKAQAVITVSQALKDRLLALGAAPERVMVLRNGVDLQLFKPAEDRVKLRDELNIKEFTLIVVGRLEALKGFDLVIQVLPRIPQLQLIIAGDGSEQASLRKLAQDLEVVERVRFLGSVPAEQLKRYYAVSDALVLASSHEGWPNVLLEAMACGTPVVSTEVGGTPEIVTAPEAGILVKERTTECLFNGITQLMNDYPDRQATRCFAEKFSWDETSVGQFDLFKRLIEKRKK